jgi:hypothetical protein
LTGKTQWQPDSVIRCLLLAACSLLVSVLVSAQTVPDPFTSAKVRVGPFAVNPVVSVSDFGVDSNVFNSWENPQSDWTATFKGGADTWLRLGKARLNTKLQVGYVYFAEFGTERSWNTDDSARLELPLTHLRPWIGVSYLNVKERPGYEIDKRARRTEVGIGGGIDYVFSRKTTLGVSLKKKRIDFPTDETIGDTYLRDVLNRDETLGIAALRYSLTPLTMLVMEGRIERERFEFSPERDANGFRILPGVEFDPHALVSGAAHVGYRNLKMLTPGFPDYTGPVADVNLNYRLLGVTRFDVRVNRDVEYSYEITEPYYVLTGATASVTQSVGGPWAVVARYGRQRLDYRRVALAAFLPGVAQGSSLAADPNQGAEGRSDKVVYYGGGISYKLGPSMRLGFNMDYYTRKSERDVHQYEGLRAGTSVTYDF